MRDDADFTIYRSGGSNLILVESLDSVVPALEPNIRFQAQEPAVDAGFIEHEDHVHHLQGTQNDSAVNLMIDRSARAFQGLNRLVAVHQHDQVIALGAGFPQQLDVACVQNIETAVGQTDHGKLPVLHPFFGRGEMGDDFL